MELDAPRRRPSPRGSRRSTSAVRSASRSSARMRRALLPTGPTGTACEAASGTFRNASPWPVAGASTIDEVVASAGAPSPSRSSSSDHDLAQHHQLRQAGRGGEEAPVDGALEDLAGEEVDLHRAPHVLVHDARRVEVDGERPGSELGHRGPTGPGAQVAAASASGASTSTSRTRLPRSRAARASAVPTRLLPTPPLPESTTRRRSQQVVQHHVRRAYHARTPRAGRVALGRRPELR